jgi:tetratricopeptide (TPR) repeat protein
MEHTFADNLRSAQTMLNEGDLTRAQKHFELAFGQAENGSTSLPEYLECLSGLSSVYSQSGAFDKEEALVILALCTIKKQLGKDHQLYGTYLNNLAIVRLHQGRLKEAEQVLLESIMIIEKYFDSGHPELLKPLENLGNIYQEQQQISKAIQSWERAISIREQCFGEADPGIKFFKNMCRQARSASGKSQEKTKTVVRDNDVQLTLFS